MRFAAVFKILPINTIKMFTLLIMTVVVVYIRTVFRALIASNAHQLRLHPRMKTILLWTPFFGDKDYINDIKDYNCEITNCKFTSDKRKLPESDAIMFHLRDLNSNDLPNQRRAQQIWILLNQESPENSPSKPLKALDGLINWTVTYRLDSDILLSPKYVLKSKEETVSKTRTTKNFKANKTHFAVWAASNCKTFGRREDFVNELQKYIKVDTFGSCGQFRCSPKMSTKCYQDFSDKYLFYFAFENSICKDYLTEKFFNVLDYDIVPVVFGGANYTDFAPKEAFVNALSFKSPYHLARYLIKVSRSSEMYNSFFEWKSKYRFEYEAYPCQICRKLNQKIANKFWPNLHDWWFRGGQCTSWQQSD